MKLIPGKMNIPFIKCKLGYAEGTNKPKRIIKIKPFNPVVILRKVA